MPIDLAPTHFFVVNPAGSTADGGAIMHEALRRDPPWRLPLPQRLRTALNLGVVCCFVLATLLVAWIRASAVAEQAQEHIRAEARALATGLAPAMEQRDRVDMRGLLEAMVHRRDLGAVAIHDQKGQRLAAYARARDELARLPGPGRDVPATSPWPARLFPGSLVLHQPVRNASGLLGTLVLSADLSSRWQSYFVEMAWICAALLGSLLLGAVLVNTVLQRLIEPIYRLERTCKVIVEDRDYTLRAWKAARDEVGSVVDCVNHLLVELHRRGGSLVEARTEIARLHQEVATAAEAAVSSANGHGGRTQFLANMCHEIRTPLNRAGALCRDLEATSLTPAQRDLVTAVHATGDLVVAVLDDLLDYTRLDSGKFELNSAEFDPGEVIETVVRIYADRARAHHLTLRIIRGESVPARVRGDRTRLRQVIGALIGNAIKYAHGGEIEIQLSAGDIQGSSVLRIDVLDSGFGIAEEARLRIHEALTENVDGHSEPSGSAALGIVIANQLIQRMGGTLELRHGINGKAGFSFSVLVDTATGPVEKVTAIEPPHAPTPAPAPRALRSRRGGNARRGESRRSRNTDAVPDADLIHQFTGVYLDSAPDLVESLRLAIESGTGEDTMDAARVLAACSARVGANQVAELCRHIEHCVLQEDGARIAPLFLELSAAFERARASLTREGNSTSEERVLKSPSLSTTLQ